MGDSQLQPMTESARDIVEQLRDHEISRHHGGCADCYGFVMDDGADEIDRLRTELASARKALEEVRMLVGEYDRQNSDWSFRLHVIFKSIKAGLGQPK